MLGYHFGMQFIAKLICLSAQSAVVADTAQFGVHKLIHSLARITLIVVKIYQNTMSVAASERVAQLF
jgi:hypothetical protein